MSTLQWGVSLHHTCTPHIYNARCRNYQNESLSVRILTAEPTWLTHAFLSWHSCRPFNIKKIIFSMTFSCHGASTQIQSVLLINGELKRQLQLFLKVISACLLSHTLNQKFCWHLEYVCGETVFLHIATLIYIDIFIEICRYIYIYIFKSSE